MCPKTLHFIHFPLKALTLSVMLALGNQAGAQPTDGQVTSGSASISNTGSSTQITQTTQNATINWDSFSIATGEIVNFMQPSSSAMVLNRVLGQDPSTLLGNLNANGQVFIINPNGTLFGNTAQVNVGGLTVSSLNITDDDFNAGYYQFNNDSTAGDITNQGNLTAAEGGYIALIAPKVINEGTITVTSGAANSGSVLMAAGDQVTLNLNNGSLLGYSVDQGSLDALADNKQLIQADGGQIVLTAKAADALSNAVVNNSGIIQARTVQNVGGVIKLMGDMDTGTVYVGGTLDASAPASGNTGTGNGGFIETSAAHVKVLDDAYINTASNNGLSGSWLIDPYDFTIAATGGDITGAALGTALGSGNVIITTLAGSVNCVGATCGTGNPAGNGDIFVNDTVAWSANTLTLSAYRNIDFNAQLDATSTAGLALEYGQGAVAAGNTATYNINAPINLASTGSFSTKLGSDGVVESYTILTSLGAAGSTTGTDLQGVNGNLTGNYVLGTDIDATATSAWNAGAGFAPIGTALSVNYKGTFDGLGHTINNLFINANARYVGIFGTTGAGFIAQNVNLQGASISGTPYTGGLVNYVGGLVGYNRGLINNVYTDGSVSGGASSHVGGLVGHHRKPNGANAIITSSYSSATVNTGIGGTAGGIAGYVNFGSQINNSYATGNVNGINNSYVGGLIGQNNGIVDSVFSSGLVSGTSPLYIGGLIGFGFGPVSNGFWDTTSSGQASSYRGTGMTTVNMMAQANFTGWDFTNNWFMVDGATRPFLRSEYSTTIDNAHQLQLMVMDLGANYTLGANIDLAESGVASGMWNTTSGFSPVGGLTTPFTGQFDGLSFTISNMNINLPTTNYVGMYGYTSAATIANANVSGSVNGFDYVGGIVGKTNALSTVSTSSFTGTVTGNSFVGGIVGWNDPSTLDRVVFNGDVSGVRSIGGITGWNDGSLIIGASFLGTVTGNDKVGGLAGENSGASKISNVIVSGSVSGATNTGGVLGTNTASGPVTASYWNTDLGGAAATGSGSVTGTTGLNSTQMTHKSSFVDLDFANTWRIYEGQSTPLLASLLTPLTITINDASKTYDGLAFTGGNGYTTSIVTDGNLLGGLVYTGSSQSALNTGSYVISAGGFYSGQGGYDITVIDGTLTVNPAPLNVTADALSKVYGSADPALTYNTAGLVNGETTAVLTGRLSRALGENVGLYAINQGTLSNPNYTITFTSNDLNITPALLSVIANPATKTFDGLAYSGGNGVTYAGLVNGDTGASVIGVPQYSGTSQGAVNMGSYVITPGGLTSNNYNISFVGSALTVVAAPVQPPQGGNGGGNNGGPVSNHDADHDDEHDEHHDEDHDSDYDSDHDESHDSDRDDDHDD